MRQDAESTHQKKYYAYMTTYFYLMKTQRSPPGTSKKKGIWYGAIRLHDCELGEKSDVLHTLTKCSFSQSYTVLEKKVWDEAVLF